MRLITDSRTHIGQLRQRRPFCRDFVAPCGAPQDLGRTCRGARFQDLGWLVPRPNDLLPRAVVHELHVLVLPLGPLPDLDLATTTDDTHPHRRKQIVSGIGVHVNAPVEHGRGILANAAADHSFASRVILDELRNIVDDTRDGDETTPILGLVDIVIPFNDGELVQRDAPVEPRALLVEFFLLLLYSAFLDFVLLELFKVEGEAHLLPAPDAPFGWVILVPFNGIAIVGREFMVEVMVAFAKGDKSSDNMVTRAVTIVERLVTEPVRQGINTESGLLDEEDAKNAGIDEAAAPIGPTKTADEHGKDQSHEEDDFQIILVLPDYDGVLIEVGDVGLSRSQGQHCFFQGNRSPNIYLLGQCVLGFAS